MRLDATSCTRAVGQRELLRHLDCPATSALERTLSHLCLLLFVGLGIDTSTKTMRPFSHSVRIAGLALAAVVLLHYSQHSF